MPAARQSPPISCHFGPPQSADVDLLIVPWFEGEAPSVFAGLDAATAGEIERALTSGEFSARPFDLFVTPVVDRTWTPRRIALIGAGQDRAFVPGLARKLATAAGLDACTRRVARLGFFLRPGQAAPSGDVDVAGFVQALAEGLTLSEFSGTTYQTSAAQRGPAPTFTIVVPELRD